MNLSLLEKEYGNVTCNCSINSFKRRVYPATYLLIFFLGLAFGGVSLCSFFSIFRAKRHFTSVNLYMFNLLVSDLMLLCSLPFRASYYLMDSGWVFGDSTCRLVSFVFYINMYGSIYFFVVLSVMRYLAVMHPYRYIELQKGRAAWVVCLVIWLVVSLASLPLLGAGSTNDNMGQTKCLELVRKNIDTIVAMNNATLFFGFVLPVAVVTFCYIYIVCNLLKPKDIGGKRRPSHRMSCALVVIVLTIFLICFLPYHVVRILFLESEKRLLQPHPLLFCWGKFLEVLPQKEDRHMEKKSQEQIYGKNTKP
ncbi:hypothetical protein AGOR_G00125750 [Albula goreensis]|uniref:G-protein coupled receptors family 1 profile domain-containing protein n=1 Tax=Albula goreensis TaxID=1534307 RepID=A0A8T3DBH3_9TELE|nr:hypothetical protein AGOR_G00125750 [Albula goreensis]